jgi:RHS repeat-associated protein
VNRTYGYQDTQYFLNSASGPWNGPLSWSYDRIGNRLTETRNSITDTYSYEANSGTTGNTARLDVVNLGIGGTRDYTFDSGGFLDLVDLGANQVDFTFDAAGQLAQMARPVAGETLNLRYDGRGLLCDASDVLSGGSTKPTYSSQGVVMSWNRLPFTGGTTEIHNVLYFARMPVVVWSKVGAAASTRQYLVADHLGTPAYAFNTAGEATWNGGLEPFGKDWQEGTANDMLGKGIFLRFPGQWDEAVFTNASLGADVYYNVHRWYEPQTGRYASPDPLGLEASLNGFAYVDSRPTYFSDPLGLIAVDGDSCGRYCCDLGKAAQQYNEFFSPGWRQRHPKCWKALASKSGKWTPKGNSVLSPLSCMVTGHRDVTVTCDPEAKPPFNCGGTRDGQTFFGPKACDSTQCGSPLNTLFHEQLHRCGAPPEAWGLVTIAAEVTNDCGGK